jgi:predicted branched-subunit amino acid permease
MTAFDFESPRAAFRRGMRDALGAPAAVLFAGKLGFGALGHSMGLSFWTTTGSSLLMYALPGQVVFVEMMATGASAFVVALAAMLTAARFFPMTLTVMPQIPAEQRNGWLYAWVHTLSMTSWAIAMRDFPQMDPGHRRAYFCGLGLVCWGVSAPGTALGYLLAGQVPLPLTLALVFLNPLFFLLTFAEVKPLANRLAIVLGGVLGPLTYLVSPDHSLLITGLIGGSLAYAMVRWQETRRPA